MDNNDEMPKPGEFWRSHDYRYIRVDKLIESVAFDELVVCWSGKFSSKNFGGDPVSRFKEKHVKTNLTRFPVHY